MKIKPTFLKQLRDGVTIFGLFLAICNGFAIQQAAAISSDDLNSVLNRSELYSADNCSGGNTPTPSAAPTEGVSFTTQMTIDDDGVGPSHGDSNHQNQTSYADGQLNADQTSYIALAPGWASAHGLQLGDIAMVQRGSRTAYAVYGDNYTGDQVHGEGSVHLSLALGGTINSTIPAPVNYTVYPGSHSQLNGSVDQSKIDQLGAQLSGGSAPVTPDASGSGCCPSGGDSTQLTGNDNETKIWNFFIQKGLSEVAAAAIVGNFDDESGWNPEDSQTDEQSHADPHDAGSLGWGLAQWTPGSKVLDEAHKYGITGNIDLLSTQLDIIWAEMKGTSPTGHTNLASDMQQFTQASQVAAAATYFSSGFEGGIPGSRITDALQAYHKLAGSTPTTGPGTAPSDGSCATGGASQFINGFTVYAQYDPRWAGDPYGDGTIGETGCGPTAMAMIITALTGQKVTPDITARYADDQNQFEAGAGSKWTIAPVLAAHWDLHASAIGANQAAIVSALGSGGLVIASGQGGLPFTSGGHYIVIRAVAADGKWLIGDPGHSGTSSQEWDPSQLLAAMNDGSVYAITKGGN